MKNQALQHEEIISDSIRKHLKTPQLSSRISEVHDPPLNKNNLLRPSGSSDSASIVPGPSLSITPLKIQTKMKTEHTE